MSGDRVNWVNAGLMVAACAAAVAAPFHVFLIAYAVLGPLHYLTEISWLHDRSYFTKREAPRRWWLRLVAFAMAVLAFGFVSTNLLDRPVSPRFEIALVYLVFCGAAAALYVRRWQNALAIFLILGLALIPFSNLRTYGIAAFFLVTIVHVFLFTAAFVLYGALKSRSRVGIFSLVVFAGCTIAAVTVKAPFVPAGERVQDLYGGFEQLNSELLRIFGMPAAVYDATGVGVMRLIAFAYLYHYLNWFSKTSIIKWHEVGRRRAATIAAVWVAGGCAYWYDFRLGFAVFYVLSMLHVLLEFPLNHQTFVEIGKSLRAGFAVKSKAASAAGL